MGRVRRLYSILRNPRDHRDSAACRAAEITGYWYERASHTGMAQLSELANLPVVAPQVLLGMGRRKGASRHTFLAQEAGPLRP